MDEDAREDLIAAVERHTREILGKRNEQIERMIVLKLLGANVRLVEDRTDPLRTVWSLETGSIEED